MSSIFSRWRGGLGLGVVVALLLPVAAQAQPFPARLIRDLAPGSTNPRLMTPLGSNVVFVADGDQGEEIWVSDGRPDPVATQKIYGFLSGQGQVVEMTAWNDAVFFVVDEGFNGVRLFTSDGTSPGTRPFLPQGSFFPHQVRRLTASGPFLYFVGADVFGNVTLWKTDGRPEGTLPVDGIPFQHEPSALADLGGTLLFVAGRLDSFGEVWRSDGTPGGTSAIASIHPAGALASGIGGFTVVDGQAYFAADDGIHGRELWRTDGMPFGTLLLPEIEPGR